MCVCVCLMFLAAEGETSPPWCWHPIRGMSSFQWFAIESNPHIERNISKQFHFYFKVSFPFLSQSTDKMKPGKTGRCHTPRACVCMSVPVQRALQTQARPGTWDPLLATAVAGHPPPAVLGHWWGCSLDKDLGDTILKACVVVLFFFKELKGSPRCSCWVKLS